MLVHHYGPLIRVVERHCSERRHASKPDRWSQSRLNRGSAGYPLPASHSPHPLQQRPSLPSQFSVVGGGNGAGMAQPSMWILTGT